MTAIDHYHLAINLTVLTTIVLAVFVMVVNPKRRLNQSYALCTFSIFAWAVCWREMILAMTPDRNLFFCRLLHAPAALVPLSFIWFIQVFLGIDERKNDRRIRLVVGIVGTLFFPVLFHPLFMPSVSQKVGFKSFANPGPLYHVFTAFFFIASVYSLSLLASAYRRESGFKRTQVAHMLSAYTIAYLGGFGVFLPVYGIRMPTFSLYAIPAAHVWILYAILKHRLMEIRILIRRTALLVGVYAALLLALVPLLLRFHRRLVGAEVPTEGFLTEIGFISAVLSTGPFLYAYFIRRSTYFHQETIAGLTHDLKTPLANIQSALGVLESDGLAETVRRDYFKMIQGNTARLQSFVESLTQVMGGKPAADVATCENIDLNALCRASAESARWIAEHKGLQLIVDVPKEPLQARADAERINLVLSNLLTNAVKFTESGTVTLRVHASDGFCRVSVSDTGTGVGSGEIGRIFDRFYQGAAGRRKKGSGLGLTIAKAWVEAHGGRIWAESEGEGKGTTVTFTLPATT